MFYAIYNFLMMRRRLCSGRFGGYLRAGLDGSEDGLC